MDVNPWFNVSNRCHAIYCTTINLRWTIGDIVLEKEDGMEKRKPTREEAIGAAAKIYAHWLVTEGFALRAAREQAEEESNGN